MRRSIHPLAGGIFYSRYSSRHRGSHIRSRLGLSMWRPIYSHYGPRTSVRPRALPTAHVTLRDHTDTNDRIPPYLSQMVSSNAFIVRSKWHLWHNLLKQTTWNSSLPIVFRGLRTALRQDLGHSPAELVYGSTLRLHGEVFTPGLEEPAPDPTISTNQLRSTMRNLRPTPPRRQTRTAVYTS